MFWAKNQLAVQTELPGEARFQNFEIMALSNGDRVYCGEMNAMARSGIAEGFVPFYMRSKIFTMRTSAPGGERSRAYPVWDDAPRRDARPRSAPQCCCNAALTRPAGP